MMTKSPFFGGMFIVTRIPFKRNFATKENRIFIQQSVKLLY